MAYNAASETRSTKETNSKLCTVQHGKITSKICMGMCMCVYMRGFEDIFKPHCHVFALWHEEPLLINSFSHCQHVCLSKLCAVVRLSARLSIGLFNATVSHRCHSIATIGAFSLEKGWTPFISRVALLLRLPCCASKFCFVAKVGRH